MKYHTVRSIWRNNRGIAEAGATKGSDPTSHQTKATETPTLKTLNNLPIR